MTEKLFYEDSHMITFSAVVTDCRQTGKQYEVVLDRTAFFPEGGGQYADSGRLGTVNVENVREKKTEIIHFTDGPLSLGETVEGNIQWGERFVKMQQHTGEHIVSGLVHGCFGYDNVGFHLGSTDCTMDFNGEITKEELRKIEWAANQVVFENRDVQVTYPDEEELQHLNYRSKIEIEGQVRIVTIPDCDMCACCAPHMKKTGEIGLIKLTGVQRYKGGVRVTMLCGVRALLDYNMKEMCAKEISAALSAKEESIVEAVRHLQKECTGWKMKASNVQARLLAYKVRELPCEQKSVCLFEEDLEGDGPRELMNLVLDAGKEFCAVFAKSGEGGFRYVMGSRTMDVRPISKKLNAAFGGRGGGKPEMVQGQLKGSEEAIRNTIKDL